MSVKLFIFAIRKKLFNLRNKNNEIKNAFLYAAIDDGSKRKRAET